MSQVRPGRRGVHFSILHGLYISSTNAVTHATCSKDEQKEWCLGQAAEEEHRRLVEGGVLGPGVSHGLLHGRLSAEEKADALAAFAAGRTNVLIATTVVEVGATLFPSPQRPFHVSSHLKRECCFSNGVILQGTQLESFWHKAQL